MLNRRFVVTMTAMIAVLLLAAPALAQTAKKYAVLPFSYNGPKKYSYFPKAFQASLNNDLEWIGHVEQASSSTAEAIPTPSNTAEALHTLRSSQVDYLITGDIAIIDKEANLKLIAVGADGQTWEKKGQMPINEITPWLEDQSKVIQGDVFKRPGFGTTENKAKQEDIVDRSSPLNDSIISATEDRYTTDTLNPQFRYQGGTETQGRWRSQTFRFYSNSMVVEDGDGDGKNEIFILTSKSLVAFRYEKGELKNLDTFPLPPNRIHLRLEAIDLDRDGAKELIVATFKTKYRNQYTAPEGSPISHILSFKNGKFEYTLKNYNKFLGVLRMPPTYTPVLVVQQRGQRHILSGRINEGFFKDGKVTLGQKITTPEFGNIYNMAYLPEDFSYKYVVIDDFHKLKVYDQTMSRLSSTEADRYNSSAVGVEYSDRALGLGQSTEDTKIETYNMPFRMLTASLSKKGKYELLVNKDLSVAAEIFERFKYFSQGEIQSLTWDGVGMSMAWKTRRIKGQVGDLYLADLNNDGKKQLCVLVNTFPGAIGFEKRKTLVLAYDLNQ